MKRLLTWLLAVLSVSTVAAAVPSAPALALYYGPNPPWELLQAFDLVVVDPGHVPAPTAVALPHTELAAYVAVGEVQPGRPYADSIPKAWLRGENKDWGSKLIDQSAAEWPAFFTDRIFKPLWDSGYRAFFLDTLDSYQRFARTPQERAVQETAMVALVQRIKQRYPQARLLFNRGFEILDRTYQWVDMVAAESLFQGFDASKNTYVEVPEEDRQWLLGQLRKARDVMGLPVIAIDYVAPEQRELARATAKRISDLGITPWVATPDLATVGIGSVEVMPRKVLVVHGAIGDEYALRTLEPVRLIGMPLNYLGYVPEYVDAQHLPAAPLGGRYAGVVLWLTGPTTPDDRQKLQVWLAQQIKAHIPVSLFHPPATLLQGSLAKVLGVTAQFLPDTRSPVLVVQQDAMVGFERTVRPVGDDFFSLTLSQGRPLLTLQRDAQVQVAAALTPWGGFVSNPYGVASLPGEAGIRWIINPFEFLRQSLQLPELPVPDVTTESGRRMLMVHMDGDGFISRSELPGNPLSGEVVRDRVVRKYPVPMTMSVIEAELSPTGLYPGLSATAEKVAKDIFRAPNVAIASHSYSHPFNWNRAASSDANEGYNLRIPGYRFDLQREVGGSVRYIQERLAPPGKKVDLFFWTGNCIPGSEALEVVGNAGLLNFNGGDTIVTRSSPTLTEVQGLGLARPGGYQVFAPNQNENVYTNNWQGPFYGYERVIETFELTEKPRRLKPINIYFHTYLTSKRAGMQSLDKVFAYAMGQETTPVYVSEYARKVLDFQTLAIARTASGWRVRGASELRTLRVPAGMGAPAMASSTGMGGYRNVGTDSYVHLASDTAELTLSSTPPSTASGAAPVLVSANARIESYTPAPTGGGSWELQGHVPLQFTLAHVQSCRVRVAGRDITPVRRDGVFFHYELLDHAARPLEAICRN